MITYIQRIHALKATTVNCGYHLSNSLDVITVGPAEARPDIKHAQLTDARGNGSEAHHRLHLDYTKHLWGSNYISAVGFVHRYIDFFMRLGQGVGPRSWQRLCLCVEEVPVHRSEVRPHRCDHRSNPLSRLKTKSLMSLLAPFHLATQSLRRVSDRVI